MHWGRSVDRSQRPRRLCVAPSCRLGFRILGGAGVERASRRDTGWDARAAVRDGGGGDGRGAWRRHSGGRCVCFGVSAGSAGAGWWRWWRAGTCDGSGYVPDAGGGACECELAGRARELAGRALLGDGRWLVYATTAADGSLRGPFVLPLTGGRDRAPLGSGVVAFTWAPDGARLYGITGGGVLLSAAPRAVCGSWRGGWERRGRSGAGDLAGRALRRGRRFAVRRGGVG
jgi:hypothetical protein